jgi:hypothetical protein
MKNRVALATALLFGATLVVPAVAQQENQGEQRREQRADQMAQQNAKGEPHMAAALEHLRQAEEELEKAGHNKGGHREKAMQLTKEAQSQIEQGIQYSPKR